MAIGTLVGVIGAIGAKKNQKKLMKELANAPKYSINKEAFENQALAKNQAFGRDRSIQMQQENIAQDVANAGAEARDITSSSSALLNTVAQLQQGKNQALRGLAQDEAGFQNQKMQQYMNVNNQMIDEKDKAWNYNVNMPFQMRVAAYRDKIKANQEQQLAGLAYEGQTVSAFASMMGGMMGGGGCDARLKDNIKDCKTGLEAVMEMRPVTFDYTHPRFNDNKNHIGFIAQEIKEIVPQAVSPIYGLAKEGEPEYMMIQFNELVPVLVNAIQEQQKKIDALTMALKMAGIVNWTEEPVTK